ncbi:MAG: radical SAM protein [Nitrospinae bacterium]|nr:radical SAM protein [Nitrospinota bacterium]
MALKYFGWEITHACNLRCLHCVNKTGARRKNELTWDEMLSMIGKIREAGVTTVFFSDGEPLMSPLFMPLARRLRQEGFGLALVTNGTLMTWEMAREIAELKFDVVGISLDGPEPVHNHVRGPAAFGKAAQAARWLKEGGIRLSVTTCVNNVTVDTLPEFAGMVNDLGADEWQLLTLVKSGDLSGDVVYFDKVVADKMDSFVMRVKNGNGYGFNLRVMNCLDQLPVSVGENPFNNRCEAGTTFLCMAADGLVKPCFAQPDDYFLGDMRVESLADIYGRLADPAHPYWSRKYCKGFCNTII